MPQVNLQPNGGNITLPAGTTAVNVYHAPPVPGIGPLPHASSFQIMWNGNAPNPPVKAPVIETRTLPASATAATPVALALVVPGKGTVWALNNPDQQQTIVVDYS
jgi:hypothetical protein